MFNIFWIMTISYEIIFSIYFISFIFPYVYYLSYGAMSSLCDRDRFSGTNLSFISMKFYSNLVFKRRDPMISCNQGVQSYFDTGGQWGLISRGILDLCVTVGEDVSLNNINLMCSLFTFSFSPTLVFHFVTYLCCATRSRAHSNTQQIRLLTYMFSFYFQL